MVVGPNVSPDSPIEEQPSIGLIGMGAMGTMYAKQLAAAGWKRCEYHRLPSGIDNNSAS